MCARALRLRLSARVRGRSPTSLSPSPEMRKLQSRGLCLCPLLLPLASDPEV